MSFTITGIPTIQGIRATTIPSERFWITSLSGGSSKMMNAATTDDLGNIYVTGATSDPDMIVQKFSPLGALLWQKADANSGSQTGNGISLDSTDGAYITGGAANFIAGIMKVNQSTGVTVWSRRMTGGTFNDMTGAAVDKANNSLYCLGLTDANGLYSVVLLKFSLDGTLQWQRRLTHSSFGNFNLRVAVGTGGDVYITSNQTLQTTGGPDLVIAKYNSSGVIQWQRRIGGTSNESQSGITTDAAGNVYVSGSTLSSTQGASDMFLIKYDSTGAIQWQRGFGTASNDTAYSSYTDAAGNTYITGSSNAGGTDGIQIVKYSSAGALLFQRRLSMTQATNARGITANTTGSFIVAGGNTFTGNEIVAKLPADGSLTGTYGAYTYSATAGVSYTTTFTDAASTIPEAAAGTTISVSGNATANSAYTVSLIDVP